MPKRSGRSTNLVRSEAPPLPAGTLIFDQTLVSNSGAKTDALEGVLKALKHCAALGDAEETTVRLCLDEALVNAITHGNGNDPSKSVRVRAFKAQATWSVLIEDQGAGFREEDLPDPHARENLLEESGRGVHLMRSIMDEVRYWRGGSALIMLRKIRKSEQAAP